MSTGPRLRLVGGRRSGLHTRRVVVEPYRTPWAGVAGAAWLFAVAWTLGSWFPSTGTGGVVLVAAVTTALAVVQRRRR